MTVRTVGVVLAGGASRRMGGSPKAAMTLGRQTLLERAAERLRPQVDVLIVNSNDDLTLDGLETVRDPFEERRGPLAGILAATVWAERNATSCGRSRRPAGATVPPSATSSPARRRFAPGFRAGRVTVLPSTAQSSCIATMSAPSGIAAPVKMRAASPRPIAPGASPAARRSVTRSVPPSGASAWA